MKKLVFATQVFGVIAMFPFVMILELNRSNVYSTESNSTSIFKHHVEMKNICLIENVTNKLEKEHPGVDLTLPGSYRKYLKK